MLRHVGHAAGLHTGRRTQSYLQEDSSDVLDRGPDPPAGRGGALSGREHTWACPDSSGSQHSQDIKRDATAARVRRRSVNLNKFSDVCKRGAAMRRLAAGTVAVCCVWAWRQVCTRVRWWRESSATSCRATVSSATPSTWPRAWSPADDVRTSGARFTKYLTIYLTIILR